MWYRGRYNKKFSHSHLPFLFRVLISVILILGVQMMEKKLITI